MSHRFWDWLTRDRGSVFGAVTWMTIAVVLVGGILLLSHGKEAAEDDRPCVCRAETCPASPALPAPPTCPPQPTLEIHKPLAEELDAIIAKYEPDLERTMAAVESLTASANAAMDAARRLGVSSMTFGWLEDADVRKAATDLLGTEQALNRALDDSYEIQERCHREMDAVVQSAGAWARLGKMDESFDAARGFMEKFYEFFGSELDGATCNMVARRLECPLPTPSSLPTRGDAP